MKSKAVERLKVGVQVQVFMLGLAHLGDGLGLGYAGLLGQCSAAAARARLRVCLMSCSLWNFRCLDKLRELVCICRAQAGSFD